MVEPEYAFTITEYDPDRLWLIRGREHRTIELDDGASFFQWAHQEWPAPRWTVQLDPWQLGRSLRGRTETSDAEDR